MKRKIVLVGAGSTSFGPSTLMDLFHSDILEGSLITLHDINEKYLGIVFDLVSAENDRLNHKFEIELTTDRSKAFKGANFIISSIEVGKRFELWKQDYEIPKKHGSKQILGECGGPGGTLHAFRIIPPIVDIVKEADKICPGAFFINFSNPLSRVCLAIKRSVRQLKFIGLCHQIGALNHHLPLMFNKNLEDLKIIPYGLNHFGFLMGLEDLKTGRDLMPQFNKQAMTYFKANEERFVFSSLTFEVYEKFGYFPYVGDNHLGEFLQFGYEFTKEQDMVDWIERTEKYGAAIFKKVMRYHARLKKGNYPRKSDLFSGISGERAVPIIEAIIEDKGTYESAVNVPNDGVIENLPDDIILECPVIVKRDGVHPVKYGALPRNIAALLRIEATVQDLCVEAILKRSKKLAVAALAVDPNVGSFKMAEHIYNDALQLQSKFLTEFE